MDRPSPEETIASALTVIFRMHEAAVGAERDKKEPLELIADFADVLRAARDLITERQEAASAS